MKIREIILEELLELLDCKIDIKLGWIMFLNRFETHTIKVDKFYIQEEFKNYLHKKVDFIKPVGDRIEITIL